MGGISRHTALLQKSSRPIGTKINQQINPYRFYITLMTIVIFTAAIYAFYYSDLLEKEEGEEDGLASVEAGMRLLEEEDLEDGHMDMEDTAKGSANIPQENIPLETMMDNFISGSQAESDQMVDEAVGQPPRGSLPTPPPPRQPLPPPVAQSPRQPPPPQWPPRPTPPLRGPPRRRVL